MQLIANALLLLAASAAAATASSSNPHRDHHDRPHQLTHQHSYRHHPVRAANITMSTNKQDHAHNHHDDAACGATTAAGQDREDGDVPVADPPVAGPEGGGRLAPVPVPVPSGATGLLLPLAPLPTGGVRPTPFVVVAGAGAVRGGMAVGVGAVVMVVVGGLGL